MCREVDLDDDGRSGRADWKHYRHSPLGAELLIAIRLREAETDKSVIWRYEKRLANVPPAAVLECPSTC